MPESKKTGIVIDFNPSKGWGFIEQDDPAGSTLFVRWANIEAEGLGRAVLLINQRVTYRVGVDDRGRPCAMEVAAPDGEAPLQRDPGKRAKGVSGRITYYNNTRHIGYITPKGGGMTVYFQQEDLFVGIRARNDLLGMSVIFDTAPGKGGPKALNIRSWDNNIAKIRQHQPAHDVIGPG